MAILPDFIQGRPRLPPVFASGKCLTRLGDIDQMVWDSRAFVARGFGGSYFEISINRNRIATDNLARESLRKMNRQRGLPGRCWAENDNQKRITRGMGIRGHSPRTPGDGPAKTQRAEQQNQWRNDQQPDQPYALTRLLARVPFTRLRLRIARGGQFGVHSAILEPWSCTFPKWR
jgi:hypothetical protein